MEKLKVDPVRRQAIELIIPQLDLQDGDIVKMALRDLCDDHKRMESELLRTTDAGEQP